LEKHWRIALGRMAVSAPNRSCRAAQFGAVLSPAAKTSWFRIISCWALCLATPSSVITQLWPLDSGAMAILLHSNRSNSLAQTSNSQRIKFEQVLSGRMVKKGTNSVSFQDYKSEDGILVQRRIESHRSPARARDEMQRMIRKATRVIERGAKLPGEGKQKGERAVLSMRRGSAGDGLAIVIWTDGPDLYLLESSSLKHALALEKQAYQYPD
jgi:hypothetical protein